MATASDKAVKLFEKAKDAFNKNSDDYALNLLLNAVTIAPDFVQARHLMHLIAKKKLEKSKVVLVKRLLGNISSIPHYIIGLFNYARKNYQQAIINYEHILINDPANIPVLKMLGDCAEKQDMLETAIDTYETIRVLMPSDIKNLKKLGDIYKDDAGELEKARECYASIIQYDKKNQDARKGLSDVAALGTIEKGSYDDLDSSFLTKVKDADYAQKAEKRMRAVKSEEDLRIIINDLEDQHRKEPNNVKTILELAGYCIQAKQFDRAIEWYKQARKLAPEDYTITKNIMNAETLKIDEAIIFVQQEQPSDAKSQLLKLQEVRTQTVIKYFKQMVNERPNDRELRYQLGRVLYEVGQTDEALKQFQISVNEPRFKLQSCNYMGLCFINKHMFDLAEVQFKTALNELSTSSQMDSFTKEVMYNLANVFEQTGQLEKAVEKYKEIYKVDIGFKDVSDKIKKTYR